MVYALTLGWMLGMWLSLWSACSPAADRQTTVLSCVYPEGNIVFTLLMYPWGKGVKVQLQALITHFLNDGNFPLCDHGNEKQCMALRGLTKWPCLSPCLFHVFSPGSETPHLGVCALNDIVVRGWKHHNSECMSKSSRCAESTAVTVAKSQKRRIMAGMWPLEFAHLFPSLMTRMYLQGTSTGVTAILLEFSDDFREVKVNSMWSG